MIDWVDEDTVNVSSFSGNGSYTITLECGEDGAMNKCTCTDFVQRGCVCKHMYLKRSMKQWKMSVLLQKVCLNKLPAAARHLSQASQAMDNVCSTLKTREHESTAQHHHQLSWFYGHFFLKLYSLITLPFSL
ncbi:hypothetical protein BJV82DRAFT_587995 [Fennellomyces sp. T-0311]|nr:hypothetical protein BJV82DRAFT_587995 [Fennellomyces sp. T-0311]